MKRMIFIITTVICSFIFAKVAQGEEVKHHPDFIIIEGQDGKVKLSKKILELPQKIEVPKMPRWHEHFIKREASNSQCPGQKNDSAEGEICLHHVVDW